MKILKKSVKNYQKKLEIQQAYENIQAMILKAKLE